MSTKSELLKRFVVTYLERLHEEGSTGKGPLPRPDFKLTARDYLRYVEQELSGPDIQRRINCVTNLKRAAECQVDTFLYTYNLLDLARKRRLGFDKKLEFIERVGLFSSRSLARFNTIRNKVEHEYQEPEIPDLEVYFDLVQVLVSVLESTHLFLLHAYEIDFDILEAPNRFNTSVGTFTIAYERDTTTVRVRWWIEHDKTELNASPLEDLDDFKYFLKVYLLLSRRESFASDKYALSQLWHA